MTYTRRSPATCNTGPNCSPVKRSMTTLYVPRVSSRNISAWLCFKCQWPCKYGDILIKVRVSTPCIMNLYHQQHRKLSYTAEMARLGRSRSFKVTSSDVKVSRPLFRSRPRSHEVMVSASYVSVSWSQIGHLFFKCNEF